MIECTSSKIYYCHCKRQKKKRLSIILIIFSFFAVFLYYKFIVSNQIIYICNVYSETLITESINSSVMTSFIEGVNYEDLVSIEKNNNGDIVLINTNSYKVNSLSRSINSKCETVLKEKIKIGVPIPLLAFTGLKPLSGYGKIINYKTLSLSDVNCTFDSTFNSVGINQTLHSIYCYFNVKINVLFPLNNNEVSNRSCILLSESVLVGKVPDFYFSKGFSLQ